MMMLFIIYESSAQAYITMSNKFRWQPLQFYTPNLHLEWSVTQYLLISLKVHRILNNL